MRIVADAVIQSLCLDYRCREANLAGAEPGSCDCPCHGMTGLEIEGFLALTNPQLMACAPKPSGVDRG